MTTIKTKKPELKTNAINAKEAARRTKEVRENGYMYEKLSTECLNKIYHRIRECVRTGNYTACFANENIWKTKHGIRFGPAIINEVLTRLREDGYEILGYNGGSAIEGHFTVSWDIEPKPISSEWE